MPDGIPQNVVKSIAETPDGYVWVATQEGLARFDGLHFTIFTTGTTPELASDNIHQLITDGNGALWILAGGGLTCYHDGQFTKYMAAGSQLDSAQHLWLSRDKTLIVGCALSVRYYQKGRLLTVDVAGGLALRNTAFYANACSDEAGSVWFSNRHGSLGQIVGARIVHYPASGVLMRQNTQGYCTDNVGNIWIASDAGLASIKNGKAFLYAERSVFKGRYIDQLVCDRDGDIWIRTGDALYRMHARQISQCDIAGIAPSGVNDIHIDNTGTCWFRTTNDHQLIRYEASGFSSCVLPETICRAWECPIAQDSKGNIWIGTAGGLCCLQNLPSRTYTVADGLPVSEIRNVCLDGDKRLWVGTANAGVAIMDRGSFRRPALPELTTGCVTCMAGPTGGNVWIVINNHLYKASGNVINDATKAIGLQPGEDIQSTTTDSRGHLWIGTSHGIVDLFGSSVRRYTRFDGAPTDFIPLIYADRFGRIWIGANNTLTVLDHGVFTALTAKNGLPSVPIISIHVDADGKCWCGSWGEGLFLLDAPRNSSLAKSPHSITRITVQNGLFANSIHQILEDAGGWLWIASTKGVFRVSRATLLAFAAGHIPRVECQSFGADDGATGDVCSQGTQPVGVCDVHGILWFAAQHGLERIDPRASIADKTPIRIEQAKINGYSYDFRHDVTAPAGNGSLEIQYTALAFRAPHEVTFRYMLQGLDDRWHDVGSRRTAYYTNVPAGNYRFVVRAYDRNGVICGTPSIVAFRIRPHYYETLIFKMLLVVLACVLVGLIVRWRMKAILHRNLELEICVADRTAELEAQNDELQSIQAELEMQNEELFLAREDLAAANDRLETLASTDGLTGLTNVRTFRERLNEQVNLALRHDYPLSVILLDVDNFKHYNDTFGHPAGDEVWRKVAGVLVTVSRSTDMPARYGGEEFIVMLPRTDAAGALMIAGRLREGINGIEDHNRAISASLGVSSLSSSIATVAELIEAADAALYHSKKTGKNRVTHASEPYNIAA